MPSLAPRRLDFSVHEKIWGSPKTQPWHLNPGSLDIGEIWFSASDTMPLLVKLLFTSDNLSVQVHPGDAYAAEHHGSRGKTEMWHILRAEPGAKIALGLRKRVSQAGLRDAALTGEIVDLLNWVPARAGDTFFVPAGTVHAIGGGLALCEVQELSDITYRLYDYDRGRELHLDHSLAVSNLEPQSDAQPVHLPVTCAWFRTDVIAVTGSMSVSPTARGALFVALEGSGLIAGQAFEPGQAWEAGAGSSPFEIVSQRARFLITAPL